MTTATLFNCRSIRPEERDIVLATNNPPQRDYDAVESLTVELPDGWEIANDGADVPTLYDASGTTFPRMEVSGDAVHIPGVAALPILSRESL